MPELPEVETTIKGLKRQILKRTFFDAWTDAPKIVKKPKTFGDFKEQIKGKQIQKIRRAGKNIIFDLSGGLSLLVHQKLTGHLLYGKWRQKNGKWESVRKGPLRDDPANRFLHLIFYLDNGYHLALSDLRKFAKVELWETEDLKNSKELQSLGPDGLDNQLTLEEFSQRIKKKKGKIKQALMDQTVIAGIGNIYSDEILFEARVYPLKSTKRLTKREIKQIYRAMRVILKKAIEAKGASFSDYRLTSGEKGGFGTIRKVYQRLGEKCFRCGAKIARLKIGGRSAHYCPGCQK